MHHLLKARVPPGWFVRNQNCIVTEDSVPEPDLAIVRGWPGDYGKQHPTGDEVGLIVEVDDSTVAHSRAKGAIYARAGVPHYWIVNLDDRQIEVFSQPRGRGSKRVFQTRELLRGKAELTVVLDGKTIGTLRAKDLVP